jgi:oligosaccharyltransferase complex subunit beta
MLESMMELALSYTVLVTSSYVVSGQLPSLHIAEQCPNRQQVYSIDVSALQDGSWRPYLADDLQLEFTMLDPHLRLPLSASSAEPAVSTAASRFSARFQAPDRHGVFTFKVDYRRAGWSFIDEKTVVSVTPPRHDQYERFITGALPYYGGAASVSIATVGFVVLWLLQ